MRADRGHVQARRCRSAQRADGGIDGGRHGLALGRGDARVRGRELQRVVRQPKDEAAAGDEAALRELQQARQHGAHRRGSGAGRRVGGGRGGKPRRRLHRRSGAVSV